MSYSRVWTRTAGVLAVASMLLVACVDHPTQPSGSLAKGGNGGGGNGGGRPAVDETDPNNAPQDTTLDIRVIGSGFDNGSAVRMLLNGQAAPKLVTNSTQFVSATELIANITIALDADTVLYDVEVLTRRGKKGIGSELFKVRLQGSGPHGATLELNGGVLGAVQEVTLAQDNTQRLLATMDQAYSSQENMVLTEALIDQNLIFGPLDPDVPSCSLPSNFMDIVKDAADSARMINELRDRLVKSAPAVAGGAVDLDKTSRDTAGPHFMKLEGNGKRLEFHQGETFITSGHLQAVMVSGDWDDATQPRVVELSGGVIRTFKAYGPKKKDPLIVMRCHNMDTVRVTIAPLQ